jgi:hypothetical protein
MTWRKNPRTITKEQFSTGTTIDGDRIDNALDDVVERVNEVPYGDMRKRWVPTTYVAGWTPQSPQALSSAGRDPTTGLTPSNGGAIAGTHHWPWLSVRNYFGSVAQGTVGAAADEDSPITNQYRLKGAGVPGVYPFGHADATGWTPSSTSLPVGSQWAWTRAWFIAPPSILDAIDLVLEIDHASYTDKVFQNSFTFDPGKAPAGYPDLSARDLVITASVDNEFSREDRYMSDVEVMRKGFVINSDSISPLALPKNSATAPTYNAMAPVVGTGTTPGSTLQGVHIRLRDLNIPLHQNARLRVSVVIPSYTTANKGNGWNPTSIFSGFSAPYNWMQQKVHMAVTMLEEVTSG